MMGRSKTLVFTLAVALILSSTLEFAFSHTLSHLLTDIDQESCQQTLGIDKNPQITGDSFVKDLIINSWDFINAALDNMPSATLMRNVREKKSQPSVWTVVHENLMVLFFGKAIQLNRSELDILESCALRKHKSNRAP